MGDIRRQNLFFSFLFFSFLFYESIAQPVIDVPCGEISLQAGGCDEEVDCFTTRQPFYFAYVGMTSPAPTYFSPSEITVTFTITITGGSGDAVFDHSRCATNITGVYNNSNGATHTLLFHGACSSFTVNLDDDCNSPSTFDLYIISDPGVTYTVASEVEAKYDSPGNACNYTCHDYNFHSSNGTGTLGISSPASCSDLELFFTADSYIPSTGVFTIDPHEEVTVRLNIKNNGGSSITLADLDLLLTLEDVNGTLPDVTDWLSYFVEATSTQGDPDYEIHDDVNGTHYFHFGSVGNGTLDPDEELVLLAFAAKPPEGLENLLGEMALDVEYLRIQDSNDDCCQPAAVDCSILFPGVEPCTGSPYVTFTVDEATSGLDDCQSGFDITMDLTGAASVLLTKLNLQFEAITTGNLKINEITTTGGITVTFDSELGTCPTGIGMPGDLCWTNTGTISYMSGTPVSVSDGQVFKVIFDGYDGTTIESFDFFDASIRIYGSDECIPILDVSDALTALPIENECTYCYDADIKIDVYDDSGSFPDLVDCEAGFSVHALKSPSLQSWESFEVELTVQNPNNLTLTVIPNPVISTNTNTCTPTYTVTGNTIHFQYCPTTPIPGNNTDITLFDVMFDGEGCVTNPQFNMVTEFDLSSASPCYPEDVTSIDPLRFCTPCQTFTIGGAIAKETGEGIDVPSSNASGDYSSGIFIVGGSSEVDCYEVLPGPPQAPDGDCDEVTATIGSCTGNYTVEIDNRDCMSDDYFTVTPYKNTAPLNGVTTFDLVLINKHILDITPLGSPYKIIAADAKQTFSGHVTTSDIIEIRKLILFLIPEYTDRTSWRFVDASYIFPDPSDPWDEAFPECAKLDFSGSNPADQTANFVAIKVGDVNSTANPCGAFTNNINEEREIKWDMTMATAKNAPLQIGDEVVLDFFLSGPTGLVAWQAGLQFDQRALELEEVLPSGLDGMNIGNFGLTETNRGKIRALWYNKFGEAVPFVKNIKLFTLKFKALQAIQDIPSLIHLDDGVLQTEAYEEDGKAGGIRLGFSSDVATLTAVNPATAFKVSSNPNPFRDKLSLYVQIQEAAYFDVLVFDALGRVVATQSEYREPGEHEILLDKTAKWGTGVFTWQVRTDKQTLSGKVVKE